jgi:hypothetical protein
MQESRYRENRGDHIFHGTPYLIFAYARQDNPIGSIDATIAHTQLDLIAPVLSLGTCRARIVKVTLDDSPALIKRLDLPEGYRSMYGMMI